MAGKSLTEADWTAAVAGMHLNETHQRISRAVLVEGQRQVSVARQEQLTKGAINQVVNRVWQAHLARLALQQGVPTGWREITVRLPEREATLVEALARMANEEASPR